MVNSKYIDEYASEEDRARSQLESTLSATRMKVDSLATLGLNLPADILRQLEIVNQAETAYIQRIIEQHGSTSEFRVVKKVLLGKGNYGPFEELRRDVIQRYGMSNLNQNYIFLNEVDPRDPRGFIVADIGNKYIKKPPIAQFSFSPPKKEFFNFPEKNEKKLKEYSEENEKD